MSISSCTSWYRFRSTLTSSNGNVVVPAADAKLLPRLAALGEALAFIMNDAN